MSYYDNGYNREPGRRRVAVFTAFILMVVVVLLCCLVFGTVIPGTPVEMVFLSGFAVGGLLSVKMAKVLRAYREEDGEHESETERNSFMTDVKCEFTRSRADFERRMDRLERMMEEMSGKRM